MDCHRRSLLRKFHRSRLSDARARTWKSASSTDKARGWISKLEREGENTVLGPTAHPDKDLSELKSIKTRILDVHLRILVLRNCEEFATFLYLEFFLPVRGLTTLELSS